MHPHQSHAQHSHQPLFLTIITLNMPSLQMPTTHKHTITPHLHVLPLQPHKGDARLVSTEALGEVDAQVVHSLWSETEC